MPPKKQQQKKKEEENLDDILKQIAVLDKKKKEASNAKPASSPAPQQSPDQNTPSSATSTTGTAPQPVAAAAAPSPAAPSPSKNKKKKWPREQTSPEPTVPIAKLYPSENYPQGEIMAHPLDVNTYRLGSREKRDQEKMFESEYRVARKAAECHRTVRKWLQGWVKPGMKMIDICERTEDKIRELMENDGLAGGIAFPMGCSLNNCAAHYTPNGGDNTVLGVDDVVKFDIGIHEQGRVVDSAFTMCWNPQFQPLLNAVREATNAGVKAIGVDVRLGDVGAAIQEVMESHEVVINGKTYKVKCVENLCGHSIDRYHIHAGKTVPIVKCDNQIKMEENEFYAIETFGSTGKGHVVEDMECSHYMKEYNAPHVPLKNQKARDLLKLIDQKFGTLAWCRRYLDHFGQTKYLMSLRSLVNAGIVSEHPPLCDIKGSYVSQFEHTIALKPTCKEVLSRGDDY